MEQKYGNGDEESHEWSAKELRAARIKTGQATQGIVPLKGRSEAKKESWVRALLESMWTAAVVLGEAVRMVIALPFALLWALLKSMRTAAAVLGEGAHAVSEERREDSEELRILRGRTPANYEHIDARIPRDADDFETVCAEWMQMAGFSGVQRTPKGPDGGVDVVASIAVGQAKFHPSQKISAEAIRALVGSRIERGKDRALFFHYGPGYTAAAIDTAVNTKVELYQLDVESQRFVRVV